MRLAHRFARQLARPTGRTGRLLGMAMDIANHRPTRLAINRLAPRPGETVLDAGCGTGAAMAQLLDRHNCFVTGVDPSATMIAAARRRLRDWAALHVSTVEDFALTGARFDAVLALNMLYFADHKGRMAEALHQLVEPGGRLVAYVTHRRSMEGWSFAREGVHRLFDEAELEDALAAGGFARKCIAIEEVVITARYRGLIATAER